MVSGLRSIRLGSPSITTRGMREPEMEQIDAWIAEAWPSLSRRGSDRFDLNQKSGLWQASRYQKHGRRPAIP